MTFMHYDLEGMVDKNHPLRKIDNTVCFASLAYRLKDLDRNLGRSCKGKDKFWYGYKANAACDMGSMLITKIAVTPANIPDEQGFKHICPRYGEMVFGDKSYCLKPALLEMKKRSCYSAAILKNNMATKNKDLDRWRSKVRAPFEGIFSKFEKRARYKGLVKIQFQAFMDALVWNTKRLVRINAPPLFSTAA